MGVKIREITPSVKSLLGSYFYFCWEAEKVSNLVSEDGLVEIIRVNDDCCIEEQLKWGIDKLVNLGIKSVVYANKDGEGLWIYEIREREEGEAEGVLDNEVIRFFKRRAFIFNNFLKGRENIYVGYNFNSNELVIGYLGGLAVELKFNKLSSYKYFKELLKGGEYLIISLLFLYYYSMLDYWTKEFKVVVKKDDGYFKYLRVDKSFADVISRFLKRMGMKKVGVREAERMMMVFNNIVLESLKD